MGLLDMIVGQAFFIPIYNKSYNIRLKKWSIFKKY